MIEYRERVVDTEGAPVPESPATGEMPAYMALAAQYGISNDMDIGSSSTHDQTIEQEYQLYITAPLAAKNIDIIKFWEVSHGADILYVSG